MWKEQGNDLIFTYKGVEVVFKMPEAFSLDKVHPDLLKIAEWSLIHMDNKNCLDGYEFTWKPTGNKVGLAFSGGVDSTAVLELYDDTDLKLFYYERTNLPLGKFNQDICIKRIKEFEKLSGKPVNIITSDMERIRSEILGKMVGYASNAMYFTGIILMADILDIKYLACGAMFDGRQQKVEWDECSTNKPIGTLSFWKIFEEVFKKVGLKMFFPVSGCSEVLTNIIVQKGKYKKLAMACVRTDSLETGCGNCNKCFRKNMLNGILIESTMSESYIEAEKINPKQFPVLVYANNKFGYNIKSLSEYTKYDMSHLEKYFTPELEDIPEELRDDFIKRITKYTELL